MGASVVAAPSEPNEPMGHASALWTQDPALRPMQNRWRATVSVQPRRGAIEFSLLDLEPLWPLPGMTRAQRLYGKIFPAEFLDAPRVIG